MGLKTFSQVEQFKTNNGLFLLVVCITDIDNQGPNTVKLKGRSKMLKVLIGLLLMSYAIPTYVYHIDWIFLNVRKMPKIYNWGFCRHYLLS